MKRSDYSESHAMEPVRVIYRHDPTGWSAESPDVPGWYGSGTTFEEARELAEEGVRFALGWDAEQRGEVPPVEVTVEHYVPESARRAS